MIRSILTIILLVTLCGCNSEELYSDWSSVESSQEIKIATYVGTNLTRGTTLDNSTFNIDGRAFQLYVTSLDNSNTSYTIAESTVTYKDSKWQLGSYDASSTWSEYQTIYWPTSEATVDFYAWYPATLTRPNALTSGQMAGIYYDTNCGVYSTSDVDELAITLYNNDGDVVHKTANGDLGLQEDIMYAINYQVMNPTQQSVNGQEVNTEVTLEFKHLLTNLKFEYKTEADIEVRIKAMTLHNVISTGTYYYYADDNKRWALNDDRPNYFSVPMPYGNSEFVSAEETAVAISGDNDLMVLSQSVAAWNPNQDSYTYTIAWNDGLLWNGTSYYGYLGAYLRIYCDIKTTQGYKLFGDNVEISSESESFEMPSEYCIFVPISSSDGTNELWKEGNQVTYTLTFGGGYHADASEVLEPITLTPTVTSWESAGQTTVSN